jgi:hypothetical protein
VKVLLGTEALLFQQLHNRRNLPHVGDRRFFDGHGFAFGAIVTHRTVSAVPCTNRFT